MTTEPTTEAGRMLLVDRYGNEPASTRSPFDSYFDLFRSILAIEHEAAASLTARIGDGRGGIRAAILTKTLAEVDSLTAQLELAELNQAVDNRALVAVQEAYRLSQAQLTEAHSTIEALREATLPDDGRSLWSHSIHCASETTWKAPCDCGHGERRGKFRALLRNLPAASHEWLQAHDADVALKAVVDEDARVRADIDEAVRERVANIKREERKRLRSHVVGRAFFPDSGHEEITFDALGLLDEEKPLSAFAPSRLQHRPGCHASGLPLDGSLWPGPCGCAALLSEESAPTQKGNPE